MSLRSLAQLEMVVACVAVHYVEYLMQLLPSWRISAFSGVMVSPPLKLSLVLFLALLAKPNKLVMWIKEKKNVAFLLHS